MPASPPVSACCFRCGYPLLSIAADRPCPECGLLARRSQRASDSLLLARPGWLAQLSRGMHLMLLAGVWPLAVVLVLPFVELHLLSLPIARQTQLITAYSPISPPRLIALSTYVLRNPQLLLLVSTLALIAGAHFLAQPEGYEPADRASRRRRRWLKRAAILPTAALLWVVENNSGQTFGDPTLAPPHWMDYAVSCLACVPFPGLLLHRLHGLAKRAGRTDLMQHCAVVGIASVVTLLALAMLSLFQIGGRFLGVSPATLDESTAASVIALAVIAAAMVSYLWGVLIVLRFTLLLRRVQQTVSEDWRADDRSLSPAEST